MAAANRLHRTEGLAVLDQVHHETLARICSGAWWRKEQILLSLDCKDEARRGAEEALKLDPGHSGARQLLESL